MVTWYWNRRDYGYRFSIRAGRREDDYYQAHDEDAYYPIPKKHRNVARTVIAAYYGAARAPDPLRAVPNPWREYASDPQYVVTDQGLCLNLAGCLDAREVEDREFLGYNEAFEYLTSLSEETALRAELVRTLHTIMFEGIYPWAGQYRIVELRKGDWVWPICDVAREMNRIERDILSRTPYRDSDLGRLSLFAAEVMGELLHLHPFREGNGRTARLIGSFLYLQNAYPPIAERLTDRDNPTYVAACRTAYTGNYGAVANLLRRWVEESIPGTEGA